MSWVPVVPVHRRPTVVPVEVRVGPVPSSSVLAWVEFATAVLDGDDSIAVTGDDVPDDAVHAFVGYLSQWKTVAAQGPEFTWSTDVASEVAEYLVLSFYRVAQRLGDLAEVRGMSMSPVEGEAFYAMLVDRLLEALAAESSGSAEFAAHLRTFWPGL